jgi:magnesium-transporting ATPase (P-type)
LYLTQFFFVFWSAFSGSSAHDRWNVAFFNTIFTALPVMAIAIFDRDLKANVAEDFPQLYKQGQKRRFFSFSIFAAYVLNSIFHSFVCFIIPMYAYYNTAMHYDPSLLGVGIVIYTCVVVVVTVKVSLETASWTFINFIVVGVSLLSWWIYIIIYSNLYLILGVGRENKWDWFLAKEWYYPTDGWVVMGDGLFWLTVLITVAIACLRDFAFKAWRRMASVELYYAAMSKGKNVSKDAVEQGFPIEEGLPIRLKGPVTVKGLFGQAVEQELGGILTEKHIQILTQGGQENYSGFAFSGEDGGKILRDRQQSMLVLNQMKKDNK